MPQRLTGLLVALSLGALAAPAQAADGADFLSGDLLMSLKRLGICLAILFGGWLVANLVRRTIYTLLCKTEVDNKIAKALGLDLVFKGEDGKPASESRLVERVISTAAYYALLLFTVMAALDSLGLTNTIAPISGFLDTIVQALPLVGKAALILLVAWVAGSVLRKLCTITLGKLDLDTRLAKASGEEAPKAGRTLADTAGTLAFWLCMLIGLAGAFEALQIQAVAAPLRGMLGSVVGLLPKVAVAVAIVFGGWLLGRISRAVVQNLTSTFGVDTVPARVGLAQVFEKRSLSSVLGLTVMAFIMVHAIITALDQLGLQTLSTPLNGTVDQFWNLLPALLVSALFLALGVVAGRILGGLVTNLLRSLGFDRWLSRMGIDLARLKGEADEPKEGVGAALARIDTPSEVVGTLAQVAVVLIALVEVLHNLGLDAWALMIQVFLGTTLVNVVLALAIVGVGFAVGNWVRNLILARATEGDAGKAWLGGAARAAVLVFAFTMGIAQLGLATNFVLLAFGLVFGALCLALALAFGLGAREVAGEVVKKQYNKKK